MSSRCTAPLTHSIRARKIRLGRPKRRWNMNINVYIKFELVVALGIDVSGGLLWHRTVRTFRRKILPTCSKRKRHSVTLYYTLDAVGSIAALYSARSGFKSQPGDRLPWQRPSVVFLGHSCEIHHTQPWPPPSISFLYTNPIIRRHTV